MVLALALSLFIGEPKTPPSIALPPPIGAVQGRTWGCAGPRVLQSSETLKVSAGGMTFSPPDGVGSGGGTWSGIKNSYAVGEKVNITLSATNMQGGFTALGCADGQGRLYKEVKDPGGQKSVNIQFTFQPEPGRTEVTFVIDMHSTKSSWQNAQRGSLSWTFSAGAKQEDTPLSNITFTAVDAHFFDDTRANMLPRQYDVAGPATLAPYMNEGPALKGVAADGVSFVLLRAAAKERGKATFTLSGAGGALYPLEGKDLLKYAGDPTLEVETFKIKDGQHAAFALYRPPSYFGKGTGHKDLQFTVRFVSESGAAGPQGKLALKLVRPPVVLVHGTYDWPEFCYETHVAEDDAPAHLAGQLRNLGYDVFCVDWKETNGSKDPSSFEHNSRTVMENKNGIRTALAAMREKNIAATQADLICHSQGGVIARMYARGYLFKHGMPRDHPHLTNPENCKSDGSVKCWYHRSDNHWRGDIHRLITISSTHRGSHVCNLFPALDKYPVKSVASAFHKLALSTFLTVVDSGFSAVTTQGFYNQQPMSLELRAMGPTPVPAHAIACTATDEDMKAGRKGFHGLGDYYFKLLLVLKMTTDEVKFFAFDRIAEHAEEEIASGHLKDPKDIARLTAVRADVAEFKRLMGEINKWIYQPKEDYDYTQAEFVQLDKMVFLIRKIVFMGDENDCTVAMHSSFGGLDPQYRTQAKNVLHGWAPRYKFVQNKLIELLTDNDSMFEMDGFPGAYTGIKSRASSFSSVLKPEGIAAPPTIGEDKPKPPAGGIKEKPKPPVDDKPKEKPLPRGSLVLESTTVDNNNKLLPQHWIAKDDGTATWTPPWMTITYTIKAAPALLPDGSGEITVDVHLVTKPGQQGTGYVRFLGGQIELIPADHEMQLYAAAGQEKRESKTWKLKPRTYAAGDTHVILYVALGDGPMFLFKYRIIR